MNALKICLVPSLILSGTLLTQSVRANIIWTDEAPGVTSTTVAGAITETFNSLSLGDLTSPVATAVGTLQGGAVTAANQYGGAGGSQFYVVGNNVNQGTGGGPTPVPGILTFNAPQSFFGMWWSAADSGAGGTSGNSVTFYNGATPLATVSTAQITAGLSSSYLGNPNGPFAGQDPTQDFVYLDFVDTGAPITSIQFNNGDTSNSSGFEMDNFSILTSVPDFGSSTILLLGIGLCSLAGFVWRPWKASRF
jgi:hypothetical protein